MNFLVTLGVGRKAAVIVRNHNKKPRIISSCLTNTSIIRDEIVIEAGSQEEAEKFAKKLLKLRVMRFYGKILGVQTVEEAKAIRQANA